MKLQNHLVLTSFVLGLIEHRGKHERPRHVRLKHVVLVLASYARGFVCEKALGVKAALWSIRSQKDGSR
jgi:hypothetical protein